MLNLEDPAKAKAAATYNAAADHFDDNPLSFWSRYGQRTVDRLVLPSRANVLDVGCGTGASALPAAERVGPTGRVTGVDLAEEPLKLAWAKAAAAQLKNIEFVVGDMEDLGFEDESFDAVVCVFAIFFVPNMEEQVARLWRLVRPGGQLAITTWGPRMFEPGCTAFWETVRQERAELHSAFRPWDRITDPESLRQLLIDGGVPAAAIEVEAEEGREPMSTPEDWWTVVLGSGYRWTVEQMTEEEAGRVRAASIRWASESMLREIETNVIYAIGTKA